MKRYHGSVSESRKPPSSQGVYRGVSPKVLKTSHLQSQEIFSREKKEIRPPWRFFLSWKVWGDEQGVGSESSFFPHGFEGPFSCLIPSVFFVFLMSPPSLATFPFTEDDQRELKTRIITTLGAQEDVLSPAYDTLYAYLLDCPATEHTDLRTMLTRTRHPRAGTSYYLWKNLQPESILSKKRLDMAEEGLREGFIHTPQEGTLARRFFGYLERLQAKLEPLQALPCIQTLLAFYQRFADTLSGLMAPPHTPQERRMYLQEKASLTFEDGSIYRLSQVMARHLASVSEFEISQRNNAEGSHAVWGYEGVHYKAHSGLSGLKPAHEAAMGFLGRTLGLEAPMPLTLFMVIDNAGVRSLPSRVATLLAEGQTLESYLQENPESIPLATPSEERYYIQATQTLGDQTLKSYLEKLRATPQPLEASAFDRTNFTAWLIFSLLTRPYDGKADNFTIRKEKGRLQILGIDNDAVFSPLVKHMKRCINVEAFLAGTDERKRYADETEIFPHIWTTLYALDPLMSTPLCGEVKKHVRQSTVAPFFTWISQLFHLRARYRHLTQQANINPSICEAFDFTFEQPSRVFYTLLDTWTHLQKAMGDPNITSGTFLLNKVSPFLGSVYQSLGKRLSHDSLAIMDRLYGPALSQEELLSDPSLHQQIPLHEPKVSLEDNLKALWSHASLRDASLETIMSIMISLHQIQGLLSPESSQNLWSALKTTWPQGQVWQRPSLPFDLLHHPACTLEVALFILTQIMEDVSVTDDQGTPVFHTLLERFSASDFRAFPWDLFQEEMNRPNAAGATPLDVAVASGAPESLMAQLVNKGAISVHAPEALACVMHDLCAGFPTPAPWMSTLITTVPQLAWHMMVDDLLPSQGPGRPLQTSHKGLRYLPFELEARLFDETGGFIRRNQNGTREVAFLPWNHPLAQKGDGLWLKLFPALSGREEAVRALVLDHLIQDAFFRPLVPPSLLGHLSTYLPEESQINDFGLYEASLHEDFHDPSYAPSLSPPNPWAVFDEPQQPQQCVTILVSQNLGTQTLSQALENDPDILTKLDPESLSWLLIMAMLVNPEDGRADNMVVAPHPRKPGLYIIASIDNDQVFVPPVAQKIRGEDGRLHTTLQVKCLLYCLDAMTTMSMHPKVVETFLTREPLERLQQWCNGLVAYTTTVNEMFTSEEAHLLKEHNSWVGSSFAKNEVLSLHMRWLALQAALRADPHMLPLMLLVTADKGLGLRYALAFHQYPTLHAHERFIKVDGEFMSVVMREGHLFPFTGTKTPPQAVLKRTPTLVPQEDYAVCLKEGRAYGPREAFEELEVHHQHLLNQLGTLFEAPRPLNQAQFITLEAYLSSHPWTAIPPLGQPLIMQDLQAGYPFKRLMLTHCDRLTRGILMTLKFTNLTVLELAHCIGVTQNLLTRLSQTCEGLLRLDISHTPLKGIYEERGLFRAPTFFRGACLHTLKASHCPNLTEVYLDTPSLQRLDLEGTPLRYVGIPHRGLEKIKIEKNYLDLSVPYHPSQLYREVSLNRELALSKIYFLNPFFENLKGLNLKGNKIRNAGVQHLSSLNLSRLTNLTNLNLYENQIGPKGAKHLSPLTNLTKLDLSWNQIGDAGAQHLSPLTNLIRLNLKLNQIDDAGVQYLSSLTKLKKLYLRRNQIGPEGAQHLSPLTNLTTLDLSWNRIDDAGVQYLSSLTKLTELSLLNNQIGSKGARHLIPLTNLTSLDLSNNHIYPEDAQHLSTLISLKKLYLSNNHIGPEGAQHLSTLINLEKLYLGGNKISDAGARHLSGLTNLVKLSLGMDQIGPEGAQYLRPLTNLTKMYLAAYEIDLKAQKKSQKALKRALPQCKISLNILFDA